MTQEERRAAFEKMSPEEREAMRERRRAMREAAGKSGDSALAQGDKAAGDDKSKAGSTKSAAADKIDPLAATSNIGSPPATSAASTSGFAEQSTTRAPRSGTVKVIDQDGKIEQRKVELGVTNRVQMQVVSGLAEGDTVIIGLKLPPSAKRTQAATGQQGGMPPGMGGTGAGSTRGR